MMNGRRKSDSPEVLMKSPNKGGRPAAPPAEEMEGRGLAKGNLPKQTRSRAQDRNGLQHALERIREAAVRDKGLQFTTLWHHVYSVERLREAYLSLKRKAAAGVDHVTWEAYGERLEENLAHLSDRLKRGAYRAKPVVRTYIPKPDGGHRPLGIMALEDKVVQRATVEVLSAIYETDFVGFSYGFRPGRSPHRALDALAVGIQTRKVNWVLDVDIRGFYDAMDHEWVIRFVEHRIADKRVVRHIKKWLKAGVLEEGKHIRVEEGTPQGASISPLLSNIYLHYAFDLWVRKWRRQEARGEMIIVRFADDIICAFQYEAQAKRFRQALEARMAKFKLTLHPEKTRLIEFGRFAARNRRLRGQGKPETFDFLGFTHSCSQTKKGAFKVLRQTSKKRLRRKLKEVKQKLRMRMHEPIPKVGAYLRSVVLGHHRYFGVPRNGPALCAFTGGVVRHWYRMLRRRSQRSRLKWQRMKDLWYRYLPPPKIHHPYPEQRFLVMTRGRSPVR
jgi:RNA-directed DNA polymerase